ncbi:DUF1566 domain-containing protein [Acinetobacter sp.]|uniref:Lcl C-terminal domain-containing protein n=1 Tax=Acinetobacter sp. TaxID=472 RepID=UPI003D067C23
MKNLSILMLALMFAVTLQAQVGLNGDGSTPDPSAMLDVKSTTRGFLAPRMTEAQKNAIELPAAGLLIYQTDGLNGYWYNQGNGENPDWKRLSVVEPDGSETIVTAGMNVTVTGSGTIANPYVMNAKTYSVGDFAQGGIVFWVDETGQHGLVCAKTDQDGGSGVRWYAGAYGVTRATGDGPFSGELNTAVIISSQVSIGDDGNDYAAQICNNFQVTEGGKAYGDWYLPSKEELNLMYQNKGAINVAAAANGGSSFASAYYWSSTEYNIYFAWTQSFDDGYQNGYTKDYTTYVRAVRAF